MSSDTNKESKSAFDALPSLIIFGLIIWFVYHYFNLPETVNKAEEVLTLHYINNDIYSPVNCRSEKVKDDYYILCGSVPASKSVPGGLYLVKYNDKGGVQNNNC